MSRATFIPDRPRGWTKVQFPYIPEYVDAIKRIVPGNSREYRPTERLWFIRDAYVFSLSAAFQRIDRDAPFTYRPPTNPPSTPRRDVQRPAKDVFVELFNSIPTPLRRGVYHGLAQALHPDKGGDEATTKALTAAWSEVAA